VTIVDAAERRIALDPKRSFCVTAPAGSGKTELLIQRFLALLARVERPEQVLAITFTRKAAAEMLERVSLAFDAAVASTPVESEHEQQTRTLAQAALAASERFGWDLHRNLAVLNIKTIDSFCMSLTRQMPILSQFGGQASVTEEPADLYREAVRELLSLLDSDRPVADDIAGLLLHFDNDWARLESLLSSMLARRDQWRDYTGTHLTPAASEQHLRETVEAVIAEHLEEASLLLQPFHAQLLDLLRYAQGNLARPVQARFPNSSAAELETWRHITDMFLTGDGKWRKTVTKAQGFPAGKGEPGTWKQRHKALTGELTDVPGLLEALQLLRTLPDMSTNNTSWLLVQRLSHILPTLAACLLLVFRRRGIVDYSQVTQSALDALGDEDAPTDLALRLDYRIEHILVDEFQDTAINQYTLVSRLSRGWGEHNAANPDWPRTLFVVGDGMQSIYGFRDASVGLFLKARTEGFNGVALNALQLRSNFRSERGLVDWVNNTFADVFPDSDNPRRGRVGFSDASATKAPGPAPAVEAHGFFDSERCGSEAGFIASRIREALADDNAASVAVLGRSRNQLRPVLAALRHQGIDYAAEDIDLLATSPAVIDLFSLCRALANPADRVAWFAVLRAPWCGLSLADLLLLGRCGELPESQDPLAQCQLALSAGLLSEEGSRRLSHVTGVMEWARSKRDRLGLRAWIEATWLRLGGPACLAEQGQRRDAEVFLQLLDRASVDGVGLDTAWLEQRVARLYAASDTPDARVSVMTLHKAKGLEFDHVFIPAMAARPRSNDRPLLLWDEYVSTDGNRGFLLAADDHSRDSDASLYNFLRKHEREKSRQEIIRLLYVGTTRAIRRLTLTATLEPFSADEPERPRDPTPESLLAPIWQCFQREMQLHPEPDAGTPAAVTPGHRLRRLVSVPAPAPIPVSTATGSNIPERPANRLERAVGTAVHKALEDLSMLETLPAEVSDVQRSAVRRHLRMLGLAGEALAEAEGRVAGHLERVLADEDHGRWMLDAAHEQAASELPLTWQDDKGVIRDSIVDRTFVDGHSGERWIIDYKTSRPLAEESVQAFAARELANYRDQLEGYRRALSAVDERTTRCALYFTAISHMATLDA
jgi:ATP-dependent exoDNAse (exonuclease V) beta subunit